MPHDPLPVDGQVSNFGTRVDVTFDGPLVNDAAINLANWTVRFAGLAKPVNVASIQGGVVVLMVGVGDPTMDPDGLSFAPPPFDLTTAPGGRAAPFADFPLHE